MRKQRLGNPMDYIPAISQQSDSSSFDCSGSAGDSKNTESYSEHANTQTCRRDGDTGLGIPQVEMKAPRVLNEKETQEHQKKLENQIRQQAEDMLTVLEADDGWQLPKIFKQILSIVLLVAASLLGVMMLTEAVQFSASVHALPTWSQWLATSGFVLFSSVITLVVLWLIWRLVRLQCSPRINIKAMRVLSERQQVQRFVIKKQSKAREVLEEYLRNYPLTAQMRKRLSALGITDKEWTELEFGQKRLLDTDRPLSPQEWCDDFQRCFQSIQDELAYKRIKQYAKRVGLGTATSPIAVVDRMIVLYSSMAMIKDLLTIYHLRPATGQTLVIFARAIIHTYLSGMLGDASESAIESLSDSFAEMSDNGLGILTGSIGSAVSAKAAEAALNGFFLYRLGKNTVRQLQPIQAN